MADRLHVWAATGHLVPPTSIQPFEGIYGALYIPVLEGALSNRSDSLFASCVFLIKQELKLKIPSLKTVELTLKRRQVCL